MKIAFISNFMNHHQLPLAQRLYEMLGDDYIFIALKSLPEERQNMGYADMNHSYPFVLCAYDSEEKQAKADKIALECNVLIAGSCPDDYIKRRTNAGKVVIKTSERYFKEAPTFVNRPKHFIRAKRHLSKFQNKPLYFLCASAYTAQDVNRYTSFKGKTYKWGYFPEVKRYDDIKQVMEAKQPTSILWVGRFIEWKHPELPVKVAKRLKEEGYSFRLDIIGTGALEQDISKFIAKCDVSDCVHMLGAMKPEAVRQHMEQSQIFLFTSDRNEGWGAVLNESMNSGCAVVANRAIGSVPYLLQHGENGLIYDSEEELYQLVKMLLDHPEQQERLGYAAYQTMVDTWNAEVAAARFLRFCEEIKEKGACDLFADGPCSREG